MHAIAFICEVGGQPAVNVIVQVLLHNDHGQPTLLAQGVTNTGGYVLFNYVPINVGVDVFISGPNVQNYTQRINLGSDNKNYPVTLTASFKKPSRDRIINVRANLCNIYDADDYPIFDAFIDWLIVNDPAKAQDWFKRLKDAKATHCNVTLSGNYPAPLAWNNNQPYPIPGMDNTQNLPLFGHILRTIQNNGLIPIVKLAFDGQRYDPNGWTYGWQWGMDNIERIVNGLSQFIESVLWSTGFDGCFPDWSPDQLYAMLRKMRAVLGAKACIDTEMAGPGTWGYIHTGNGAADWTKDKLGILDHLSLEAESWPPDTGEPLQQIATRMLGPNCKIGPQTPYYLAGLDKTVVTDVYETWATVFIRKNCTPQQAVETANQAAKYGFTAFGNGIPSTL